MNGAKSHLFIYKTVGYAGIALLAYLAAFVILNELHIRSATVIIGIAGMLYLLFQPPSLKNWLLLFIYFFGTLVFIENITMFGIE